MQPHQGRPIGERFLTKLLLRGGTHLVAEVVAHASGQQKEEDSQREEESLQGPVDAQSLDKEAEGQYAPPVQ